MVAEVEQVAEHLPLGRGEVARDRALVLGVLDRFLDLVAKGRLGVAAENQGLDPAPQPRSAFLVRGWPSAAAPHRGRRCRAGRARAPRALPCPSRPRPRHGRSRARWSVPWTMRCAAWSSSGIAFAFASAAHTPRGEDDVAEHQLGTVAGAVQLVGFRPSERTARWSAGPCRARSSSARGLPRRRSAEATARRCAATGSAAGRRFRRSPLRPRPGRGRPSRCYCPTPRRIRWRLRAS